MKAALANSIPKSEEVPDSLSQCPTQFLDSANVFCRTDVDDRILAISPAITDLTGIAPKELLGRAASELYHTREERLQLIHTLIEQQMLYEQPVHLRHRDGRAIPCLITLFPRSTGERYGGTQEVIRTLLQEPGADASILDHSTDPAYTEAILATISAILIGVNENGVINRWNEAAEATLGQPASVVMGTALDQCSLTWDWPKLEKSIATCQQTLTEQRIREFKVTTSESRTAILNLSIICVGGMTANAGVLIVGNDITEQKMTEVSLAHSRKMESVGQLAAGIAHEINTPTQFIGDNTRFLQDAFGDMERLFKSYSVLLDKLDKSTAHQEIVQEVKKLQEEIDVEYLFSEIPHAVEQSIEGLDRVSRIVRAMKDFSHPGSEEKQLVDLHKAIDSTVTVARNEWKYAADVRTDFDQSLPLVPCYAGDLNQVFLNLLVNAAHAIQDRPTAEHGEKGLITISTRHWNEWVEIKVSDTGTGIPEEALSRIFDPFFTTKAIGKGTGQGLSIVHGVVVDQHKGTINVETARGEGTTFILRLPLDDQEQNGLHCENEEENPLC